MKNLILLRGLPGAGKSTLAKLICDHHVEADMWFEHPTRGYEFDASKLMYAHRWCRYKAESWMKEGHDVVVSNTFTRQGEFMAYESLAEQYGYRLITIIVENRHGSSSVHNVPAETIAKMRERFQIKLI